MLLQYESQPQRERGRGRERRREEKEERSLLFSTEKILSSLGILICLPSTQHNTGVTISLDLRIILTGLGDPLCSAFLRMQNFHIYYHNVHACMSQSQNQKNAFTLKDSRSEASGTANKLMRIVEEIRELYFYRFMYFLSERQSSAFHEKHLPSWHKYYMAHSKCTQYMSILFFPSNNVMIFTIELPFP